MAQYRIWNAPSPTTAKIVAVTTGTNIKTMLQVSSSATKPAKVKDWGWMCDAPAAAALCSVELIEVDVAATVTAHVTAGIMRFDPEAIHGGDPVTNLFPVGTAATGYTATAEGSITTSRVFDAMLDTIPTSSGFIHKFAWPLGCEPVVQISKFLRIRNHLSSAVNALCWVTLEI